jgi:hypothetical protein
MGGTCSKYGGEDMTGVLWGDLRERDHLEDQGAVGRIILRGIFRKWDVRELTRSIWLSTIRYV